MSRSHFFPLTLAGVLAMTSLAVSANRDDEADEVVAVRRFTGSIDSFAHVGDQIEVPFETDSFTGPIGLKIEVRGKEVFPRKPIIALSASYPLAELYPGGVIPPPEIRAYLTAEAPGEAVILVTPQMPPGSKKIEPRELRLKVLKRGVPFPIPEVKP